MALLRNLTNVHDIAQSEADERHAERMAGITLSGHAFETTMKRMAKTAQWMADEEAELEAIALARPVGAEVPRVEPKSIDDVVAPSRIGWEPPKKRYVAAKPYKSPF